MTVKISKADLILKIRKTIHWLGLSLVIYLAYVGLVYIAWNDIKPWSGSTGCHNVCSAGQCGCSFADTLYNETIFLIGQSHSWAVAPFLGHVFPQLSFGT